MTSPAKQRTVIVCLPATSGEVDWLSASAAVAHHTDTPANLATIFPTRRRRLADWLRWWRRRRLLAPTRHSRGSYAAGGRVDQLDLRRAEQQAWLTATARWATWRQVTTGLKAASGWQYYQRRHRQAPERFSLPDARRAFVHQPAIAAMLAHNAIPGAVQLDPYEVEAYQAGQRAYATCHMLAAACGHAMLTADGVWLQPESGSFADQLTYLKLAAAHLHALPGGATIVALTT